MVSRANKESRPNQTVDGGGKVSSGKTSKKVEVKDPEAGSSWKDKVMKGIGDAGKAVAEEGKGQEQSGGGDTTGQAILDTGKAIGGMIEEGGRRRQAAAAKQSSSGGGKGGA